MMMMIIIIPSFQEIMNLISRPLEQEYLKKMAWAGMGNGPIGLP
jgi:hypothetical protein